MELTTLTFEAPVEIQATAAGKPSRVAIVAYNGATMDVQGFGPVVLNLSGLDLGATVPLLADHSATIDGVAGVGAPRIEAGRLIVEGTLASNATAGKIRELAASGVPLQASVGIAPTETARVKAGDAITANGQTIKAGPRGLTLVKAGTLREVSILPLGADSSTSVHIAARARAGMSAETTTNETEAVDPIQAERARVQGIFDAAGDDRKFAATAIEAGWTVHETKSRLFDLRELRGSRNQHSAVGFGRGTGPVGKPTDIVACATMLLAGREEAAVKHYGEPMVRGMGRPRGWVDLCGLALRQSGMMPTEIPTDREEIIKAAFSTASIANVVSNVQNKLALDTFIENSSTWRPLVRTVTAQDFKEGKAVRLTSAARFEEVPPGGEIKHGTLGDDAFDFRVKTYAKMFGLTRQDIINDDLGLLTDLPRILGSEAARGVSDLFYDLLIANTGSFFGSGNGNLMEAGSALDIASLSDAIKTLRTRKDDDNRLIGFQPQTLVVPAALETTARALLNSTTLSRDTSVDQLPTANPMANIVGLVVEPRLDAASTTAWYLFGRPSDAAFLVAFLDGKQSPTVESEPAPFNMLGAQWRAFMDYGVSQGEPRAAVRATGQS